MRTAWAVIQNGPKMQLLLMILLFCTSLSYDWPRSKSLHLKHFRSQLLTKNGKTNNKEDKFICDECGTKKNVVKTFQLLVGIALPLRFRELNCGEMDLQVHNYMYKQLLDEASVISGIINIEVSVIS